MIRKSGVKLFDETHQVDWLVVRIEQCPDEISMAQLVARHFRVPHEPWGNDPTFVDPVSIRKGRRRILFRQESGVRII